MKLYIVIIYTSLILLHYNHDSLIRLIFYLGVYLHVIYRFHRDVWSPFFYLKRYLPTPCYQIDIFFFIFKWRRRWWIVVNLTSEFFVSSFEPFIMFLIELLKSWKNKNYFVIFNDFKFFNWYNINSLVLVFYFYFLSFTNKCIMKDPKSVRKMTKYIQFVVGTLHPDDDKSKNVFSVPLQITEWFQV